ncbi:Trehalose/maltose import ATP-binding protein MalK [Hyphomicrobiales bacterium]|nr:Trehalose/maltose import ATP-binding protein MalK [Hyphomicrobiales bacterium]CAH1697549.1 Trehalose/maltose import ATP-binding protein MalK [Hyphomicrobiales bacterium]CAI0346304.1 Trehalose/maltose import ATP-binding protein MalK [Hyphomicrobiales bacterium]
MSEIVIANLNKRYGKVAAVKDLSLTIAEGEMVTLLGPSGCGKSTTLGALAGLEAPTSGKIRVGNAVFFDSEAGIHLPPERRDCGMVFQSYALWPHMTVEQNCAYPLKLRKVPRAQRRDRVMEALALVEMAHLVDRYPHELSGGQQQRVALARTLVFKPRVLLLDEPLSNLDAKLRDRARAWLKSLQKKIGLTTLFVTHDQTEALSMSDRVAVMNQGHLVQIDTPRNIYERPADRFVADFIGTMNFVTGQRARGGGSIILSDGQHIPLPAGQAEAAVDGADLTLALRPERLFIDPLPSSRDTLEGRILDSNYLGNRFSYQVEIAGQVLRVESECEYRPGPARLAVDTVGAGVFPAESGARLP